MAISVVTVVLARTGDEFSGGRGFVGGAVDAHSLDHYVLMPFGRVAVYGSPIRTGPHAYQASWRQ